MEKCKHITYKRFREYHCSLNASIEGYCKTHHPGLRKQRQEKIDREVAERRRRRHESSPFYRLQKAIELLEKAKQRLVYYEDYPLAAELNEFLANEK